MCNMLELFKKLSKSEQDFLASHYGLTRSGAENLPVESELEKLPSEIKEKLTPKVKKEKKLGTTKSKKK